MTRTSPRGHLLYRWWGSWARAVATGRASGPPPLGVHLALMIVPWGFGGQPTGAPRGARRGAVNASRGNSAPGAGSSWVWATATGRAAAPPPLGVHNGHVPGLQGPPRASGAAHGTTRRSATLTQMEPVRAPTFGDALRAAKTHPDTPDTLGVRVVTVLGPLLSRWPPRGGASSGTRESNRSLSAPRPPSVLGWLS